MASKFQDDRETDLFGHPVRPRHGKRGRPSLQVTDEDRDAVDAACARGWGDERIAKAIGISPASLKRHFRAALDQRDIARDRLDLAIFATTAREAVGGNMTAVKQLRQMQERDDLLIAKRKHDGAQKKPEKSEALGKKALADAEAKRSADPDSGWGGDLDFPGLVN